MIIDTRGEQRIERLKRQPQPPHHRPARAGEPPGLMDEHLPACRLDQVPRRGDQAFEKRVLILGVDLEKFFRLVERHRLGRGRQQQMRRHGSLHHRPGRRGLETGRVERAMLAGLASCPRAG